MISNTAQVILSNGGKDRKLDVLHGVTRHDRRQEQGTAEQADDQSLNMHGNESIREPGHVKGVMISRLALPPAQPV